MPPYIPKEFTLALLGKIPGIPTRSSRDLLELYARLLVLLDRFPHKKLLSVLKYAAYLILLLNIGSLPFVWHIRVYWPILVTKLDGLVLRLKLLFASKKQRTRALITWAESLSPVGANPFEFTTVYTRWASIDDIDVFGMHLSNSSYAKALDTARVHVLVKCFPTCGRGGGQMALGATHYHFIREISPLTKYEIRLTIGAWDHKWVYLVARYVTRPTRRQHARASPQSTGNPPTPNDHPVQNGSASVEHAVAALVQADPDHPDNGTVTRRAPIVEPDGAVLHCVAVSQICFKAGRITIPPAIILASEGFTKPYADGVDAVNGLGGGAKVNTNAYSRTNPPPNWIKSQSIRVPPHGSMDAFQTFLRGGWRDVPAGERWWEDALGGSIERKRQANLEVLDTFKQCLEQTRTLH